MSAHEKERWTQEAIRQNSRRQAFGAEGFKISKKKGIYAANIPFNKDIRSCVNVDGSMPYILPYSTTTGLGSTTGSNPGS